MATIKFAVTPGFEVGGSLFKPKQLAALSSIVGDDSKIEITSFKQLYIEIDEERASEIQEKLENEGLMIYPVGPYVKSLRTCSFCQGAEAEGLHVALALNKAVAGIEVPSTLRIGYTGCTNACGEPLLQDIGVVKNKDLFDIYIGGEGKTLHAQLGQLYQSGVREEMLINEVMKIINYYKENGKKREKFSRFVKRVGIDSIKKSLEVSQ